MLLETQLLSRFIPGAEGLYGYVEDAITTKLADFTFWDFASIVSYGNPGVAVTNSEGLDRRFDYEDFQYSAWRHQRLIWNR